MENNVNAQQFRELNLYQKINFIMSKIDGISKDKFVSTGGSNGYKAVTHDDVTALLHKPCADMGIVVIPSITRAETISFEKPDKYGAMKTTYRTDLWMDVVFINADKPDERHTCSVYAYGMDSSDKATGKAFSMGVKYAFLKTFMLESYDDEEARNGNDDSYSNNNNAKNYNNNAGNNFGDKANNAATKGTNHVNDNNKENSQSKNTGDKKASQAQINAIKKICEGKKINVGEKFKNIESCTSLEASAEIKRLNTVN